MNKIVAPQISYLSESSVLLEWGSGINTEANRLVHLTATKICSRPFEGFLETVPAYDSLAVFFNPYTIANNHPGNSPFETVKKLVLPFTDSNVKVNSDISRVTIRIPVLYNGPDLKSLAGLKGLTEDELVQIHTCQDYDVFMLGFLPGFAYLGIVSDRIAAPRLAVPRVKAPAGSVGIAGNQTGVYPIDSPGGWQLIGVTPLKMFDVRRNKPCLLNPGDKVRFFAIEESEFKNFEDAGGYS